MRPFDDRCRRVPDMTEKAIDFAYLSRQTAGDHELERELLTLFAQQCVVHLRAIHGSADRQARMTERRAECFDKADADKNGQLSRAEFDKMAEVCGHGRGGMGRMSHAGQPSKPVQPASPMSSISIGRIPRLRPPYSGAPSMIMACPLPDSPM